MAVNREDLPHLITSMQFLCDQFSKALARDPVNKDELINLMEIYELNFPSYEEYLETWEEKLDTPAEKAQIETFGQVIKQLLTLMNLMMKKLNMVSIH